MVHDTVDDGRGGATARTVARCPVPRLRRRLGLCGAVRGRTARTTTPDLTAPGPLDRVDRDCTATRPNPRRWGADLTSVATWRGCVYAAFVIDVVARRIVALSSTGAGRAASLA